MRLRPFASVASIVAFALLMGGLAACDARVEPTAPTAPEPPAVAPNPTPAPEGMEEARKFRETFGLRADDAWIIAVAANPDSDDLLGVPLLAFEATEMMARTTAYHEAGPIILDYGRSVPDDWFGSYIDQHRGGIIVAEFFRNTDQHRDALARLLPPRARWEVRQVDQRTLDRIAFVERLKADRDWFTTIDAELLDVVTNPLDGGIVELTYLAHRRDLTPAILEHYGAPEWLRVERAGAPLGIGTEGDLAVKATDPSGRPVRGLICDLGAGQPAVLMSRDGLCRLTEIAAVTYRLQLRAETAESTRIVSAATVQVRPGRSTTVTMVVRARYEPHPRGYGE